ncbi:MAG: UDP-N-acetylenolpyruvoylglucosamine reductase, partial [Mastigocladus sp. ERB_26_1]
MAISQAAVDVCTNSGVNVNKRQTTNSEIKEIPLLGTDCAIKSQVPLSAYTSYRVGGPAEWYVAPRNIEAMHASLIYAKEEGLPVTVLGAGSNLLVSDRGIPGLVIATRHLRQTHFDPETGLLTVAAGEPIPGLAMAA